MHISEILPLINYTVSDVDVFAWRCFGDKARSWTFLNNNQKEMGEMVIGETGEVLFVNFYQDSSAYYWVAAQHKTRYNTECSERQVLPEEYLENISSIELEVESDVLDKIGAIFKGEGFDKGVLVSLELDNDVILNLSLMAHDRGITLNALINDLLAKHLKNSL